jgi:hypothetical protein
LWPVVRHIEGCEDVGFALELAISNLLKVQPSAGRPPRACTHKSGRRDLGIGSVRI